MRLLKKIRRELREGATSQKALSMQRFFKTAVGTYGAGDKFLGIMIPQQRRLAKSYQELSLAELKILLASPWHEERSVALLILLLQYQQATVGGKNRLYAFYVANIAGVNNWDLVDLSAPPLVGTHLLKRDKSFLHKLIQAESLWERRIAIVATWQFIRHGFFTETLRLAKKLLRDREELLHKATGWMLREVGKRDGVRLESFLQKHYQVMPRTMLRYAIERFPEERRLAYLRGEI